MKGHAGMDTKIMKAQLKVAPLLMGVVLLVTGCAKNNPLPAFVELQKDKISQKGLMREAEPLFWAATYEPDLEDLESLRTAWREHAKAFPESQAIKDIDEALRKPGQKVLLVSLFTSDTDRADLTDKSLGWVVHSVPTKISELSSSDVVLRTLFPVKNSWARYFILKYPQAAELSAASVITIGNAERSVELERKAVY